MGIRIWKAFCALTLFLLAGYAHAQETRPQKPNIVFILVDNVGWGDFSIYGGSTPTPRIDKLAGEGIRFTNYTVESQCTPTRSALMTGRQSVRSGTFTQVSLLADSPCPTKVGKRSDSECEASAGGGMAVRACSCTQEQGSHSQHHAHPV
jgi:hypothetical protein